MKYIQKTSLFIMKKLFCSLINRELLFSCWTHRKQVEWSDQIKTIAEGTGKEYTEEKRFNSFAPIRTDSHGTW